MNKLPKGLFNITDKGLNELPKKTLVIDYNGKKIKVKPENPLYSVIEHYHPGKISYS